MDRWNAIDATTTVLGSIISELGGFPVKEAKFRREMEKLRYSCYTSLYCFPLCSFFLALGGSYFFHPYRTLGKFVASASTGTPFQLFKYR